MGVDRRGDQRRSRRLNRSGLRRLSRYLPEISAAPSFRQRSLAESAWPICAAGAPLSWLIISLLSILRLMPPISRRREFVFLLFDVARLLRTLADQRVRGLNMTRAQWAVLARLERFEGLKQSELAESLEIQPITLTRLVDRLCANGLVERRADPQDRRAKRLFLTAVARPLVE